eukprot:1155327-Pelagomonas_calceolata.AAC.3
MLIGSHSRSESKSQMQQEDALRQQQRCMLSRQAHCTRQHKFIPYFRIIASIPIALRIPPWDHERPTFLPSCFLTLQSDICPSKLSWHSPGINPWGHRSPMFLPSHACHTAITLTVHSAFGSQEPPVSARMLALTCMHEQQQHAFDGTLRAGGQQHSKLIAMAIMFRRQMNRKGDISRIGRGGGRCLGFSLDE